VADCGVAVDAENGESEDRCEPVEPRRRVEQLAYRLAEYPLLDTGSVNSSFVPVSHTHVTESPTQHS